MFARLTFALALAIGPTTAPSAVWAQDDDWYGDESLLETYGFVEMAGSSRVVEDPTQPDDYVLGEARFQLELEHVSDDARAEVRADFVADAALGSVEVDLREAALTIGGGGAFDLRAGRQVLTWGTGDLLFLNDLFPKDYVSFFTGRADEYLKAPTNALRLGLYAGSFGVDLVWMPIFEPDRFITGRRLSYFDPATQAIVGRDHQVASVEPDLGLDNGEAAMRLHWNIDGWEPAVYGYLGFSKQPLAFDAQRGLAVHSRLAVYGFSLRGTLLQGIVSLEGAFHHSFDDAGGDDPAIPNSEVRGLVGYERELVTHLTLGLQYYLEAVLQHAALLSASSRPDLEPEELTHSASIRLTWRLLRDDLTLSLFALGSPTERDLYVRPSIDYRVNDAVRLAMGGNVLVGEHEHTAFGQLQNNTNVFSRIRYSF